MKAFLQTIPARLSAVLLSTASAALVHAAPGDLDTTFPGGGKFSFGLGASPNGARGVVVQPDGKVIVVSSSFGPSRSIAVVRYNADASRDISFGGDGEVITSIAASQAKNPASAQDDPVAIALTGDGKIVVRYHPDGALDTSFGINGKVTTDFAAGGESAHDMVLQADGKIVVAGLNVATSGPGKAFLIARYREDALLDRTFGRGAEADHRARPWAVVAGRGRSAG